MMSFDEHEARIQCILDLLYPAPEQEENEKVLQAMRMITII